MTAPGNRGVTEIRHQGGLVPSTGWEATGVLQAGLEAESDVTWWRDPAGGLQSGKETEQPVRVHCNSPDTSNRDGEWIFFRVLEVEIR